MGGLALAGGLLGGLGSLFGGLFGNSASKQYIQALQGAEQWLKQQEQTGLQNYSPYLNAGQGATTTLSSLLGTPGQGLLTPWTQQFTPLTGAQVAQTPGYQFQFGQGESALQNSAAAKGGLLTGRTMADLNNFAQGTANTAYQQYGVQDPLLQYQSAYQSFLNNQNNTYSRLMGLSGEGLSAAGGAGNFIQGMGGDIASLMGQKGAAAAGGTMALGQGIGGMFGNLGQTLTLSSLLGGGSAGVPTADEGLNVLQPSYMPGGGPSMAPPTVPGAWTPQYAMGTDYAAGGPSIVGEAGPEMVNLPRGAQVIPNYQLSSLAGGVRPPVANPLRPVGPLQIPMPRGPMLPPGFGSAPPRSLGLGALR